MSYEPSNKLQYSNVVKVNKKERKNQVAQNVQAVKSRIETGVPKGIEIVVSTYKLYYEPVENGQMGNTRVCYKNISSQLEIRVLCGCCVEI